MRRVEDRRFLTGRGRFVEDINLPGQCYGVPVMSTHAHARILRVDTAAALRSPGVVCVLTGADAISDMLGGLPPLFMPEDMGGPKGYRTLRPLLAAEKVLCVGDRIAFVIAETLEQARDAAELVEIDFEPLPSVVRVEDAVRKGAHRIYEDCPENVSFELAYGNKETTDFAFANAEHVVSLRLVNNRLSPNALEPRGAIGDYDPGERRFTLYTSSQNPHGVRQMMAGAVFKVPENQFRVVAPDVGGGFGVKADAYPEDALVLWASRRCGRPVKWIATRSESMIGDNHGRDQVVFGEMALDRDGRILAIRARALQALGAYVVSAGVAPPMFALRFIPGAYDVKTVHLTSRAVFTNTTPVGVYRGAGRPEAVYLTERLLDRAAQVMGIDQVEIRRRNLIPSSALPYVTATGCCYDSGQFQDVMRKCTDLADWDGFPARHAASAKNGKLRGRAISYYIEQSGVFNDRMELRFDPSGCVTIVAGTHSHGQGHATVFAQMVSSWLGLPLQDIRFVQGDTDQVPFGRGTYAARSSMVGGCALSAAAEAIIDKARPMAAHLMEVASEDVEFREGQFCVVGTNRSIALSDVAREFFRPIGLPTRFGVGLDACGYYATDPPNHPNGCHVCEVEVDPETGEINIDRYTAVDDVGHAVNPLICEGQIHGGLAQGIGQALIEAVVFDRESGQLLSGSFMDYGMPRADDLPSFTSALEEIPAKTNPLGVKGVGESGTVGAASTIVNALLDALRPLGVDHIDMPTTPSRVWECIRQSII